MVKKKQVRKKKPMTHSRRSLNLNSLRATGLCLLTLALGAGSSYALLSVSKDNNENGQVTTGITDALILETSVRGGELGADPRENYKKFYALATGSKATIVRVKLDCSVQQRLPDGTYTEVTLLNDFYKDSSRQKYNANGEPTPDSPFTWKVRDAADWFYNPKDNYWYNTKILNAGGTDNAEKVDLEPMGYDWAHRDPSKEDYVENKTQDTIDYSIRNYPADKPNTTGILQLTDITVANHNEEHSMKDGDGKKGDGCNGVPVANPYSRYIVDNMRITMRVVLEEAQASNGAYLLKWGDVDPAIINRIGNGDVTKSRDQALKAEQALDPNDRILTPLYNH